MDRKPFLALIEAAKQMEELLQRNGILEERRRLGRPVWDQVIAAAERALAPETMLAELYPGKWDEALRLADEMAAMLLDDKDRHNWHFHIEAKAREYRAARGFDI